MADAKTDSKPKFEIHKFVPEDKPGFYDEEVQALIEAGPESAITVQVPNTQKRGEKDIDAVAKYQRFFQESAKRFDRTAKLISKKDNGDGSTNLEFVLREKITRERKPKDTPIENAPESTDAAPAENAAPAEDDAPNAAAA